MPEKKKLCANSDMKDKFMNIGDLESSFSAEMKSALPEVNTAVEVGQQLGAETVAGVHSAEEEKEKENNEKRCQKGKESSIAKSQAKFEAQKCG